MPAKDIFQALNNVTAHSDKTKYGKYVPLWRVNVFALVWKVVDDSRAPEIIKSVQIVIGKMHPNVHKSNTLIPAFTVRDVCDTPRRSSVNSDVLLLNVTMGIENGPQIFWTDSDKKQHQVKNCKKWHFNRYRVSWNYQLSWAEESVLTIKQEIWKWMYLKYCSFTLFYWYLFSPSLNHCMTFPLFSSTDLFFFSNTTR